MDEVPLELLGGPFTVERALSLGVSRQVLRGRRFRAPCAGVRVAAGLPDTTETRCRAVALVLPPEAAFTHDTAAELLRLWLPHRHEATTLHVTVPADSSLPRRTGITGHHTRWQPGDLHTRAGLRLTSAARTLCDLAAAGWTLLDLVVIADCIQHRGYATREELQHRIAQWAGAAGARSLRKVATLTRPKVDSAMETRLRLLLQSAGLPEPQVNETVYDHNGEYLHRPDLSWQEWKTAVDYDGAHHLAADEHRRRLDISRKEALEEAGWTLRVLTARDLLQHPQRTVERVRRTLRERGSP